MGDFTVHISQAEVASAIPEGQFFVVDSHQVQQRRVEIVDVHFLLGGVPAEVVGGSVNESRADTSPSEAEGVAVRMMLAPVGALAGGASAEFTAPNDQRIVKQSARLEVRQKRANRFVGCSSIFTVALFEFAVLVPVQSVALATLDLDEADTPLGQASCQQAAIAETLAVTVVEAVHFFCELRFASDVKSLRSSGLHAECEFIGLCSGGKRICLHAIGGVSAIEFFQQRQLGLLLGGGEVAGIL